ncbi:MAG: TRAP transporter large permease subunit, partial [bacterium]
MLAEPSSLLLTLLMFGVVFALMTIGMPVTFCFGVTGVVFAILFMPSAKLFLIPISMYGAVSSPILMAVPAFIFMGNILVYTGIAKEFFNAIYQWLPIRGSLAVITEIIGAGFASICGGSVPTTLAIGNIALPEMLRRGYDKDLALGSVGTAGL